MTKALRVPDYLGHILKAIERIDRYTADMDEVAFLNSELVQDAVIRNIEIIGEASNNIQRVDPAFAAQHDAIPQLRSSTVGTLSIRAPQWLPDMAAGIPSPPHAFF